MKLKALFDKLKQTEKPYYPTLLKQNRRLDFRVSIRIKKSDILVKEMKRNEQA